jgi:RNA polymerase sigma factor (sigma-70 family)
MKTPGSRAASSGAGVAKLLSDAQLVRRAAKGDQRAFAVIYQRYGQSLYRYCFSIVGRAEEAQDALQNTMVKALRALPGEQRQIQLKPWLYRVAHNESIELLRKRREDAELDPELLPSGAEPEEAAAHRERLRRLLKDLGELPERQRGALVMRELAGFDFAQIGEALGTSAAVARQTVYEARLSLRQLEAGREMSCAKVMWRLSEADGRTARRRDIQAHLRSCPACREFRHSIVSRREDLVALAPLSATASSALLQTVLGGGSSGVGGGLASSVGVGASKAAAGGTIAKSAAAVAVIAAIGVSAADRGGLIDVGVGSDEGARISPTARPVAPTPPNSAAESGPSLAAGKPRTEHPGRSRSISPNRVENGVRADSATSAAGAPAPSSPSILPPPTTAPTTPSPAEAQGPPPSHSTASHGEQTTGSRGNGRGQGHGVASDGGESHGHGHGWGHEPGHAQGHSGEPPGHATTPTNPAHGGHNGHGEKGPPEEHVPPDKSHGSPFQQPETPTTPGSPEAGTDPSKEAG